MPEIKLTLRDPARAIEALRYVATEYLDKQRDEGMVGHGANYPIVQYLADSIEEQVKPPIEEPTAFGSVVRAFVCGSNTELWVRTLAPEYSGWTNIYGSCITWAKLCEPEVLRIGVGEAEAEGEWDPVANQWVVPPTTRNYPGAADEDMTAAEFDARMEAGTPVEVNVNLGRTYTKTYSAADVAPEETEDYRCGVQDTKVKVLQRLRNLRDGATGERQFTYGWAIDAVEGIA